MLKHRHRLLTLALAAIAAGVLWPPSSPARPARSARAYSTRAQPKPKAPAPPPGAAAAITANSRNGNQYVFWRTTRGRIEEAWYNGSWHGPVSRGWRAASAPTAVVTSSGHQFVLWRGADGDLYEAAYTRRWERPVNLTRTLHWGAGGQVTAVPAIAVDPAGDHRYVFWRGRNGRIREAWNTGRWHGPLNRGWASPSAPSAGVSAAGRQYVFWTAGNGDVIEAWHRRVWSRPLDLTRSLHWGAAGHASSAPGAGLNRSNAHQYVFWRGPGDRVYEAYYDGRWHGPVSRGWRTSSAPSVGVSAQGHQTVFWLAGRRLYEAWHQSAWTGAVGRWTLGVGRGAYAEVVQTTANLSQRMTTLSDVQFASRRRGGMPVISVDDRRRYQRVKGVGAAMTDTSAWLIGTKLRPSTRAALMRGLFTTGGIHLGFTLIPMGGSDFSVNGRPYSYDDLPPGRSDPALVHFSTAHDQAYILPVLRQMLALSPHTETFAVPWSPPGWMKANHALDDLGHRGTLLPSAYQPLAHYFVRFLQAYAQQGVPVQAVAPENEPRSASPFPAMYFPQPDEARFISGYLAPALAAAGLHPHLYGSDTSWTLENYATQLATGSARPALKGIAWHCYGGIPNVMSHLRAVAGSVDQIVTECAPNLSRYPVPEIVIGAMRNWASNVTLWNIATDPSGGPVEPPNSGCHGCRGLVTIDERTHALTYNLDYYQLGQVGTFVQSGGWRIASNTFVSFQRTANSHRATNGLDDVAVRNPDGSRVLIVYNHSSTATRFGVAWRGRSFTYTLPAGATVTFRWNP
ncbi:MAG: hypothetical protein M3016_10550 [Actinomycetota bacterium]|nr:hypothetical protein [Actinomycetota bacterium]